MSTRIAITLPDGVYQRAERLADLTRREVADVLADALELSLPDLGEWYGAGRPMSDLSDEEVLALTELQIAGDEDKRLTALLDKQQGGRLTKQERENLARLMQIYQEGFLRKAEALAEAVSRGLRDPLSP